jgi:hypothetical protein
MKHKVAKPESTFRRSIRSRKRNQSQSKIMETWPLTRLREHPLQEKLFFDPSDDVMSEFRAELRNICSQPPIHALRDGTVVRGSLWLRAAVAEGRKQILVTVRDDIAEASSAAAAEELIRDNLRSRPVSDLEKAACYLAIRQSGTRNIQGATGDARDRIAEELGLGLSGRSLDRLARLLKLPVEIRKAIAGKTVSRRLGEQILALRPGLRMEIAAEMTRGASASQIINKYFGNPNQHRSVQAEFNGLVSRLHKLLPRFRKEEDILVVADEKAREVVLSAADWLKRIGHERTSRSTANHERMPPLPTNVGFRSSTTTTPDSARSPAKLSRT